MTLVGIELRNFRSIGDEPVVLKPWRKCNILIGRNNSGKSNVIRAIERLQHVFSDRGWTIALNALDRHMNDPGNEFGCTLHLEPDPRYEILKQEDIDYLWFQFSEEQGHQGLNVIDLSLAHIEDFRIADNLLSSLVRQRLQYRSRQDDIRQPFLQRGREIATRFVDNIIPPIHIIPEFRQIRPGEEYALSGANLIGLLAEYDRPVATDWSGHQAKFNLIQDFVRRLLHLPDARLQVPSNQATINIVNNGLALPIESYGTGMHEIVIMVTAVLSIENEIFCIEEPEIHLHPTLQREFIQFITEHTSNTYLISTHSPTLINAQATMPSEIRNQIQVFHLELKDGATVGGPVLEDTDSLKALNDLGVKASDILQANCVIWVEGPSDRIYLNRWLALLADDLVEDLDYSIMFYGGRLLSHLGVTREKDVQGKVPDELIDILRINQHAIVLMDSDKESSRKRINKTKQRVKKECESSESLCWITDGREIENYLSARTVSAACEDKLGIWIEFSNDDKYTKFDDILRVGFSDANRKGFDYSRDKVNYARLFANHIETEDISDELRKCLDEVIDKIREWNQ